MRLKCPHCRSRSVQRSVRDVTNMTREMYWSCRGKGCGHRFKSISEFVATIVPSRMPLDGISLALTSWPGIDKMVIASRRAWIRLSPCCCPHCGARKTLALDAREVSPTQYASVHLCINPQCGFVGEVVTEIVGSTKPSLMPNPAVILPLLKGAGMNFKPIVQKEKQEA